MVSFIILMIAVAIVVNAIVINYFCFVCKKHPEDLPSDKAESLSGNADLSTPSCHKPKNPKKPKEKHKKHPVRKGKGSGISLLVPFTTKELHRQRTWEWLHKYYRAQLPGAEIIVQGNKDIPFRKTRAVNTAFRKSSGDIIVILDADCYIDTDILLDCANQIRKARKANHKLWFMPYRNFYRLTERASNDVLASAPSHPLRYPDPPPHDVLASTRGNSNGHWFGALIQVMPREAFIIAGGMDERFAGWGGEDVSFMRAVDTLYCKHKSHNGPVFHLWHPATLNPFDDHLRLWDGQDARKHENDKLMGRYYAAFGDKARMQRLTSEW